MSAVKALERGIADNAADVWDLLQDRKTYVFLAGLETVAGAMDAAMAKAAGSEEAWKKVKQKLQDEKRWSELLYS